MGVIQKRIDKKLHDLGFEISFENRSGISYIRMLESNGRKADYSQRVDLEKSPDGSGYVLHSYKLGGSCGFGATHCSQPLTVSELYLFYVLCLILTIKRRFRMIFFRKE